MTSLTEKTGGGPHGGGGNFESIRTNSPPPAKNRRARKKPNHAPNATTPAIHQATPQKNSGVMDKPNKGNRKPSYHNASVHSSPEPCTPPPKPPDDFQAWRAPREKDPTTLTNDRDGNVTRNKISRSSTSRPPAPLLGPQRESEVAESLETANTLLSPQSPLADPQSRTTLLHPVAHREVPEPSLASSSTAVDGTETTSLAPSASSRSQSQQHGRRHSETGGIKKSQSKPPPRGNRTKRKAAKNLDDSETPDESQGLGQPSQRGAIGNSAHVCYACPFFRIDPYCYFECAKSQLKGTSRVTQHLIRTHERPIQCPKCGTVFPSEKALHEHIRSSICENMVFRKIGLSQDQMKAIKKLGTSDQKSTWFELWKICWEGCQTQPPPPPTDSVMYMRAPWPVEIATTFLPMFLKMELGPALDQLVAVGNIPDRRGAFQTIIESLFQRVPTYLEDNLSQSRQRTRQAPVLAAQDRHGTQPPGPEYPQVQPNFRQDPTGMAGVYNTNHDLAIGFPGTGNGCNGLGLDSAQTPIHFSYLGANHLVGPPPAPWIQHGLSQANPIASPLAQNTILIPAGPYIPPQGNWAQHLYPFNATLGLDKNNQLPAPNAIHTNPAHGPPANADPAALKYGTIASSPVYSSLNMPPFLQEQCVSKNNQQYPPDTHLPAPHI